VVERCVHRWPKPWQCQAQHRDTGLVMQEFGLSRKKKKKALADVPDAKVHSLDPFGEVNSLFTSQGRAGFFKIAR
jgi:hypothetical protein